MAMSTCSVEGFVRRWSAEHFDPNLRNFPTNVDTVTKCNAKLKAEGLYSNDVCVDDE